MHFTTVKRKIFKFEFKFKFGTLDSRQKKCF